MLLILSSIYALKLIFDIIKRMIQSYKIIPEFIQWYKNDVQNIKSIMSIYFIQNICFMVLSLWILYMILSKLNTFIDDIYLIIISLGILTSIIFFYNYPCVINKSLNINIDNMKDYPIWVYVLLLVFMLFYILIIPLIIINVLKSDKFMFFMKNLINDYDDYCKHTLRNMGCYMDAPSSVPAGGSDAEE